MILPGLGWIIEMSGFTNIQTTKDKRFGLEKTTLLHMVRQAGVVIKGLTSTQALLAVAKKILRAITIGSNKRKCH
jgi:hypothetical protein